MPIDPVAATISLGELVYTIGVEVKKVYKFKKNCHKLAEKTALLFGVLQNNQERLGKLDTIAPLIMSFRNCLSFIIQCQEWNLGSVVLEVIFRQKYPKLMAEMDEWMKAYSMETRTETLGNSRQLIADIDGLRTEVRNEWRDQAEDRQLLYNEMKTIGVGVNNLTIFATDVPFSNKLPHFDEYDSRIKVKFNKETNIGMGTFKDVNPIICLPLSAEAAKPMLPKVLQIYHKISARIQVQRLYGVLRMKHGNYSIMEDLTKCKTLAEHIKGNESVTLLQRLNWAYQIANTMAYLHNVGIVLKVLSDESVVMQDVNGTLRPVLTDLALARLINTSTDLVEYDIRYSAPEYDLNSKEGQSMHTFYTDIWSLAVVIWQCLSLKFPFDGADSEVVKKDPAAIKRIVHQGLPWGNVAMEEDEWGSVVNLLRDCWQKPPILRPSAAFVAQRLLDVLTQHTAAPKSTISESSPATQQTQLVAIKQKCLDLIQQKRDKKKPGEIGLTTEEFGDLVKSNRDEFDPVGSFLIGAVIWWKLSDFDEWDDDYSEAYDFGPEAAHASRALRFLTNAVGSGCHDAAYELSKALALLARRSDEIYKNHIKAQQPQK